MLESAKKVTNGDGYLHIEYARWADDCVILIDGHQKWDWLGKSSIIVLEYFGIISYMYLPAVLKDYDFRYSTFMLKLYLLQK